MLLQIFTSVSFELKIYLLKKRRNANICYNNCKFSSTIQVDISDQETSVYD